MAESFTSQIPIKPDQILEIIIRRRWLIIIPLCITLTYGLFHTLTANKTYEASTLILVQAQRVPTNYVRSVVTSTISQRISTISQQILSRSNLEKIIDQFGLFENSEGVYLEDKIISMRKRVQVKIERSRQGAEAFSIVFKGSDPQKVMRVANTLASYFMDENLKVREAQAVGTSEFLDSELEKTRTRLEDRERRLSEYRQKYLGGLPDELETNLRTLDRLQQQITSKNEMLRQANNTLNLIETQIAQSKELAAQNSGSQFSSLDFEEDMLGESENEKKLSMAQKRYDNILLKYTEKHPDAAKLKKTIEKIKETIEEEEKVKEEASQNESAQQKAERESQEEPMANFAVMQLEAQQKKIKIEIQKVQ
ncbi:MAG: protein GumC, partial [Proteobacteria bacterium]|nr:protein GumC [Pseudomonadota bacterium]